MTTFTFFYGYTEYGRGRVEIDADSKEEAQAIYDENLWAHEDEEVLDSDSEVLKVLEGSRDFSELDHQEA